MRIISWTLDEILAEVKNMESDQKNFKLDLSRICWYMRGGVTYEEVYYMSPEEREIVGQLVKENLETTKKTQMPFF